MIIQGDYIIDTWNPKADDFISNGEGRIILEHSEYMLHIKSDDGKFETKVTLKDILYGLSDML